METVGLPPDPRYAHGQVYERTQQYLIIYGGRNDYPNFHKQNYYDPTGLYQDTEINEDNTVNKSFDNQQTF